MLTSRVFAPTPFVGCVNKIERAKELQAELTNLVNDYLKGCKVVGDNQHEKGRYVFRTDAPPVPIRIAILAGEIFHHVRSCLDHMVWAVSNHEAGVVNTRLQFPVTKTPKEFRDILKADSTKGIPRAYHDLLEELQPYKSEPIENSVLGTIHRLNIIEKHRLLLIMTTAMLPDHLIEVAANDHDITIELAPAAGGTPHFTGIENGQEIHWIKYSPASPNLVIRNKYSVALKIKDTNTSADLLEVLTIAVGFVSHVLVRFINHNVAPPKSSA